MQADRNLEQRAESPGKQSSSLDLAMLFFQEHVTRDPHLATVIETCHGTYGGDWNAYLTEQMHISVEELMTMTTPSTDLQKIRAAISVEQLYGVNLPDLAGEKIKMLGELATRVEQHTRGYRKRIA